MKNEFQRALLMALVGFSAIIFFLFKSGKSFTPNSIIFAIVGFFVFWISIGFLCSFAQYLVKGYSVEITGDYMSRLIYKEKYNGSIELFNEPRNKKDSSCYFVVTVPSESEWREKMPEWAKDRQHEIMERIMNELKASDFRFPGYAHN